MPVKEKPPASPGDNYFVTWPAICTRLKHTRRSNQAFLPEGGGIRDSGWRKECQLPQLLAKSIFKRMHPEGVPGATGKPPARLRRGETPIPCMGRACWFQRALRSPFGNLRGIRSFLEIRNLLHSVFAPACGHNPEGEGRKPSSYYFNSESSFEKAAPANPHKSQTRACPHKRACARFSQNGCHQARARPVMQRPAPLPPWPASLTSPPGRTPQPRLQQEQKRQRYGRQRT